MFRKRFAVAVRDYGAGVLCLHRQMSCLDRKNRADGQSQQVIGEGQLGGFIEVVYSPDQAAFDIPPGSEIFDMKVAHAQDLGSFGQIRTDLRPHLHPAIKRGPQEWKYPLGHTLVLQLEIALHQLGVRTQPGFILSSCLADVHGLSVGHDRGEGNGCQTEERGQLSVASCQAFSASLIHFAVSGLTRCI